MLRLSRQMFLLASIYAIGLVVTWWLAIHNLFINYAGRDAIAFWVVLPLAWTLSYWPMAGSLLMAIKIWRMQSTLEAMARRARANDDRLEPADRDELIETLTTLAAQESHVPRFLLRPLVRRFLRASRATAAAQGA